LFLFQTIKYKKTLQLVSARCNSHPAFVTVLQYRDLNLKLNVIFKSTNVNQQAI
jgi:hypothetical protein